MDKPNTVELKEWTYECGEPGCCYDYGTELIVNGHSITTKFDVHNTEAWEELFKILGVKVEISYGSE